MRTHCRRSIVVGYHSVIRWCILTIFFCDHFRYKNRFYFAYRKRECCLLMFFYCLIFWFYGECSRSVVNIIQRFFTHKFTYKCTYYILYICSKYVYMYNIVCLRGLCEFPFLWQIINSFGKYWTLAVTTVNRWNIYLHIYIYNFS